MKAPKLVIPVCLTIVCFISLARVGAQSTKKPDEVKYQHAVDQMLRDFATAASTLDAKRGKALFLPPDETPEGKNRQTMASKAIKSQVCANKLLPARPEIPTIRTLQRKLTGRVGRGQRRPPYSTG